MAGIICQVELAPQFLSSLVEKLKSVVAGLPSLVPEDFYLPSPPLYCPQPGEVEMVKIYLFIAVLKNEDICCFYGKNVVSLSIVFCVGDIT